MLLTLVALWPAWGLCQTSGELKVEFMTASLDSLVTNCRISNETQSSLEGFRVQIYSGSGVKSKDEAQSIQAKFLRVRPDVKAYIVYNAPFWRVRVGDFRSRSEAMVLLEEVKGTFSGSYIVRDNTVKKKTFRR